MQQPIDNDTSIPIPKVSRHLERLESTVKLCLKVNLRYKFCKMRNEQLLTEKMKMTRLLNSKKLLHKIKTDILCWDRALNRQNNRWLAVNFKDVSRVMKTKFPVYIIVFGVVSCDGYIIPPHIFQKDLRVNQNVYQNVLATVVKPWSHHSKA